jgi:excisionase family DNA binding protein
MGSCVSSERDGTDDGPVVGAGGVRRAAGAGSGGVVGVLLLTPAQAAGLLQVRESWLRRRAGERRVPCSFVGKHLRFSYADVEAIAAEGARPARPTGRGRGGPVRGARLRGRE